MMDRMDRMDRIKVFEQAQHIIEVGCSNLIGDLVCLCTAATYRANGQCIEKPGEQTLPTEGAIRAKRAHHFRLRGDAHCERGRLDVL